MNPWEQKNRQKTITKHQTNRENKHQNPETHQNEGTHSVHSGTCNRRIHHNAACKTRPVRSEFFRRGIFRSQNVSFLDLGHIDGGLGHQVFFALLFSSKMTFRVRDGALQLTNLRQIMVHLYRVARSALPVLRRKFLRNPTNPLYEIFLKQNILTYVYL